MKEGGKRKKKRKEGGGEGKGRDCQGRGGGEKGRVRRLGEGRRKKEERNSTGLNSSQRELYLSRDSA